MTFLQFTLIASRILEPICIDMYRYFVWIGDADMEKDNLFTQASFEPTLFYPKMCVNCNQSEFTTKQHKMYFTKSMSKIRLPHIYRGNNYYVNNNTFSYFKSRS